MLSARGENLLQLAQRSLDHTVAVTGEEFPHFTRAGRWQTLKGDERPRWQDGVWRHGNWTGGFWVGCLWLASLWTRDSRYASTARRWAERLAGREQDDSTHDLGFLFYPSHIIGDMLVNDPVLSARALAAAASLASRFVDSAGYIQAWGPRGHPEWGGTSTIDTMMNLPLLWWAAWKTGDIRYSTIAATHARTTREHFFRPDGSTYHLLIYDVEKGLPLRKTTFQGYADESCWSRGQSWAISGFVIAYRETHDERLLSAAEDAADYFLQRLPDDLIPYWDFKDPAIPDAPQDSSAAAIAVEGFLELATIHPNSGRREYYRAKAHQLLEALAMRCQNREPETADGVLLHGCYSRPHDEGIDSALTWGDYFYLHGLVWALTGERPEKTMLNGGSDRDYVPNQGF